nr:hypothetical protein Iba_chr07aCG7010 [Ipomoea batatas]
MLKESRKMLENDPYGAAEPAADPEKPDPDVKWMAGRLQKNTQTLVEGGGRARFGSHEIRAIRGIGKELPWDEAGDESMPIGSELTRGNVVAREKRYRVKGERVVPKDQKPVLGGEIIIGSLDVRGRGMSCGGEARRDRGEAAAGDVAARAGDCPEVLFGCIARKWGTRDGDIGCGHEQVRLGSVGQATQGRSKKPTRLHRPWAPPAGPRERRWARWQRPATAGPKERRWARWQRTGCVAVPRPGECPLDHGGYFVVKGTEKVGKVLHF